MPARMLFLMVIFEVVVVELEVYRSMAVECVLSSALFRRVQVPLALE